MSSELGYSLSSSFVIEETLIDVAQILSSWMDIRPAYLPILCGSAEG